MIYNLYKVNVDGSKELLQSFASLSDAQSAMTDISLTYSIEEWDGCFATVLI